MFILEYHHIIIGSRKVFKLNNFFKWNFNLLARKRFLFSLWIAYKFLSPCGSETWLQESQTHRKNPLLQILSVWERKEELSLKFSYTRETELSRKLRVSKITYWTTPSLSAVRFRSMQFCAVVCSVIKMSIKKIFLKIFPPSS